MAKLQNIIGNTYGRLTVIAFDRCDRSVNYKSFWLCRCDCGKTTIVNVSNLKDGHTQSCGCLQQEIRTKHGEASSLEYESWQGMIQRCTNPNNSSFFRYGMRGITVCEQWLHSFPNFLADMGRRPKPDLSLDRIDNEKGYYKENCRWATRKEQQQNKRTNRWLEYQGKRMVMLDWARYLGMPNGTFRYQLKKRSLAEIIERRK